MSENHKYLILGGAAFLWMIMLLVVFCLGSNHKSSSQMPSGDTVIILKQKPPAWIDINTMRTKDRLIPTRFYSSPNPYAHRYIKTENSSLYTSSSRLGEGDGEYSGFYRGMLWYNSVFNQYEGRDWLGR
ncbi:hypothetical protein HY793_01435 [Candidatus Desantisbacteria bacterium]|nr:hypothetical protein [Candidatus Desantisbacteria bacterium]